MSRDPRCPTSEGEQRKHQCESELTDSCKLPKMVFSLHVSHREADMRAGGGPSGQSHPPDCVTLAKSWGDVCSETLGF